MEIIDLKPEHINLFISFIQNNENDLNYFFPHKMDYDNLIFILKNNKKDQYKIITYDEVIIGYGILRGWDEGYEIPSLGIIIDKKFRGVGLSKLLMLYLETLAKILGSKKIRLVVHKDNQVAYNLYKKLNYEFSIHNKNQLIGFKQI